jgi:hypothetical protein
MLNVQPAPELPLADCIGWENGVPELRLKVRDLLYKLMCDIEALGDGNPYWSSVYFTPQGNPHTAYANGKVKEQVEPIHPVRCADFTEASQFSAFEAVSDALYEQIKNDKPQDSHRLIWRERPEAGRELHEDGLYIKIYTRIGWDKSAA